MMYVWEFACIVWRMIDNREVRDNQRQRGKDSVARAHKCEKLLLHKFIDIVGNKICIITALKQVGK